MAVSSGKPRRKTSSKKTSARGRKANSVKDDSQAQPIATSPVPMVDVAGEHDETVEQKVFSAPEENASVTTAAPERKKIMFNDDENDDVAVIPAASVPMAQRNEQPISSTDDVDDDAPPETVSLSTAKETAMQEEKERDNLLANESHALKIKRQIVDKRNKEQRETKRRRLAESVLEAVASAQPEGARDDGNGGEEVLEKKPTKKRQRITQRINYGIRVVKLSNDSLATPPSRPIDRSAMKFANKRRQGKGVKRGHVRPLVKAPAKMFARARG